MRAVVVEEFGAVPVLRDVPRPACPPDGALVRVTATGLCRSDWHALAGHDPDVVLPHVPGHEFAGVLEEVGPLVAGWAPGRRVTAPFVNACGRCPQCLAGEHQVCAAQEQPGFTFWGSFAEHVVVRAADVNLVALPDGVDDAAAAALGCRFATAYRAVVDVAGVRPGERVAVHGCGGVGLSAVMVAVAAGASVVAVDVSPRALGRARALGADVVDASGLGPDEVAQAVRDASGGGTHVGLDALGAQAACHASIAGLLPRGRHVQVGLLPSATGLPAVPMHLVVAGELAVLGSHGMAAHAYPGMLDLVASGRLRPGDLVGATIGLDEAGAVLHAMGAAAADGVTVALP